MNCNEKEIHFWYRFYGKDYRFIFSVEIVLLESAVLKVIHHKKSGIDMFGSRDPFCYRHSD
jgi:hypothetical protein